MVNKSREDKVKWTEKTFGTFRKLCIEQVQLGNRSGLTLSSKAWQYIGEMFHQQTGQLLTRDKFKNKWDVMRKEYKEWVALKKNYDGHDWDLVTNTVKASNDWWEDYLKIHPYASRYRKQGLEHEEDYDLLFSNATVKRKRAINAVADDSPSDSVAPIEESSISIDLDGNITQTFCFNGNGDDATQQMNLNCTNLEEEHNTPIQEAFQQTNIHESKRQRNPGASQLTEKIAEVALENCVKRRAQLESKQSTSLENDMLEVQQIIEDTLPTDIEDEFRYWVISSMVDPMKRAILKTINLDRRLGWLQFEYNQWKNSGDS